MHVLDQRSHNGESSSLLVHITCSPPCQAPFCLLNSHEVVATAVTICCQLFWSHAEGDSEVTRKREAAGQRRSAGCRGRQPALGPGAPSDTAGVQAAAPSGL